MFGFLKRRAPEGPVQFEVAVEVDRPASDVYPLLDWSDPRNAKRELGHKVEPIDGQADRFRLTLTEMPKHRFDMTVTKAVANEAYAFSTEIKPRIGRLENDEEHYSLEPIGDNRCKLRLTTIATFQSGLTKGQFKQELAMMTVACQRALVKLKAHAEHGVQAVKALDSAFYG
ncbi:MAG TPA: SRPBCC family protein [Sphingomicrobium sp.]